MKRSVCRSRNGVGVAPTTSYDVVSSGLKTITSSCSPCYAHALLPSDVIAACDIRLVLRLLFLVKGKLNVELQSVPDALPDPYPFIRGMVVTWYTASTVDPGSGTPDRWSSSGRSFQQARILNTALAIPRPTRWHPIKTSAEDMAKLLAAMAVHEL